MPAVAIDPKSTEIHDLRNKLISLTFALEQITFARYADKCHEIARKALEVALAK